MKLCHQKYTSAAEPGISRADEGLSLQYIPPAERLSEPFPTQRLPDILHVRHDLSFGCAHPLEQVGPENSHQDEDAEQTQAADEKQNLRHVRPQPVALEGILRRRGVSRLQDLQEARDTILTAVVHENGCIWVGAVSAQHCCFDLSSSDLILFVKSICPRCLLERELRACGMRSKQRHR